MRLTWNRHILGASNPLENTTKHRCKKHQMNGDSTELKPVLIQAAAAQVEL